MEHVELLKMASEYLGVQVLQGASVLLALRTICVSLQSTFWDVFESLVPHLPERAGRDYHTTNIASVHIAKSISFCLLTANQSN